MGHALTTLESLGRILTRFNGATTISLGDSTSTRVWDCYSKCKILNCNEYFTLQQIIGQA